MGNNQTGKAVYLIYKDGLTQDATLKSKGLAGVRLPVAPLDQIAIEQGVNLNNNVVPKSGSVVFGGGPGLATLSFNSLLPIEDGLLFAHDNTSQYPWMDETMSHGLLRTLASDNAIFRLVVSEAAAGGGSVGDLGDNRLVWDKLSMISSYSASDEEGDCLWYQIAFTQFKELTYTTVKKDLGPLSVVSVKGDTLQKIADKHRQYGATWKNLLNLNPKLKQPVTKKGATPAAVKTQKDLIKVGSKVILRTASGVIDSVDLFNITNTSTTTTTNSG